MSEISWWISCQTLLQRQQIKSLTQTIGAVTELRTRQSPTFSGFACFPWFAPAAASKKSSNCRFQSSKHSYWSYSQIYPKSTTRQRILFSLCLERLRRQLLDSQSPQLSSLALSSAAQSSTSLCSTLSCQFWDRRHPFTFLCQYILNFISLKSLTKKMYNGLEIE